MTQAIAMARSLLLTALLAGVAHAQLPEPSPPPLVTGEPGKEEAVLEPAVVANPPLPPEAPAPPSRMPRIAMGLLVGAGAGALGGVAGGFIGQAAIPNASVQPLGGAWTGAAIGFALLAPVGVLLAGRWFEGNGAWWATALGDLLGVGLGVASVAFGGAEATPLLFALPLAGSVIGSEVTSSTRAPTPVAVTFSSKSGTSTVSLLGRF